MLQVAQPWVLSGDVQISACSFLCPRCLTKCGHLLRWAVTWGALTSRGHQSELHAHPIAYIGLTIATTPFGGNPFRSFGVEP